MWWVSMCRAGTISSNCGTRGRIERREEQIVRDCGLVVSTPAWDGTGWEFDSWQCRTYIPCSLSLRLLGSLRGSLGTYELDTKIVLKTSRKSDDENSTTHRSRWMLSEDEEVEDETSSKHDRWIQHGGLEKNTSWKLTTISPVIESRNKASSMYLLYLSPHRLESTGTQLATLAVLLYPSSCSRFVNTKLNTRAYEMQRWEINI